MKKNKGQAIIEYAVIFAVMVAAVLAFIPAARAIFEAQFQSAVRKIIT